MPRGSKPGERRGGRKRGTPNKVTRSCRQAIEFAADALGGGEALARWAKKNQTLFWSRIYVRLLPVSGSVVVQQQDDGEDAFQALDRLIEGYARVAEGDKAAAEPEAKALDGKASGGLH